MLPGRRPDETRQMGPDCCHHLQQARHGAEGRQAGQERKYGCNYTVAVPRPRSTPATSYRLRMHALAKTKPLTAEGTGPSHVCLLSGCQRLYGGASVSMSTGTLFTHQALPCAVSPSPLLRPPSRLGVPGALIRGTDEDARQAPELVRGAATLRG
ncbi:hypothetical protein K505DRAFT_359130 [Melanomma pulvis-pyrius CBS 109.77]|uniref:Uncharacterized protein n=1 Tax=Melanomma pulvis-pyrius CBS 109.77 TaxID=1314802 RepID=A0A6A6XJP2_9PLEO|nr:hypothetical protein K505DRAFT_359130 [Melanomma pulvis-pyrius CBS 109.77]